MAVDVVDVDLSELLLQVLVVSRLSTSDFVTEVICKSKGGLDLFHYDHPHLVFIGILLRVCFTPQARVLGTRGGWNTPVLTTQ